MYSNQQQAFRKKMKLQFLGSGSAFTVGANNYQSNMLLINDDEEKLLIDCGSDARFSLYECGYTYKDIQNVYISHLHADHVGGLEWLAFTRYFDKNCDKPNIYLDKGIVDDLWNKVLAGGLSSLEDIDANLSTYFNVKEISDIHAFKWAGKEIKLVQTFHFMSNAALCPSFGLMFKTNNLTVFISTDTKFDKDHFSEYYQKADIIFHDCETTPIKSGIHTTYDELKTLDPAIKSKMWLYHYNPGPLPNAIKDGFRGFIQKGQIFDFNKE